MKKTFKVMSAAALTGVLLAGCSDAEPKETEGNATEVVNEENVTTEEITAFNEENANLAFLLFSLYDKDGYVFIDSDEEGAPQDKILALSTGVNEDSDTNVGAKFKYKLKALTKSGDKVIGVVEKEEIPSDASPEELKGMNITLYKVDDSVTKIDKITYEREALKEIKKPSSSISFSTGEAGFANAEIKPAEGVTMIQSGTAVISTISAEEVVFEGGKTFQVSKDFSASFASGDNVEFEYETDSNNNVTLTKMEKIEN